MLGRETQKTNNLEHMKVGMNDRQRSENWAHGLVGRGRKTGEREIIRTSKKFFPYWSLVQKSLKKSYPADKGWAHVYTVGKY